MVCQTNQGHCFVHMLCQEILAISEQKYHLKAFHCPKHCLVMLSKISVSATGIYSTVESLDLLGLRSIQGNSWYIVISLFCELFFFLFFFLAHVLSSSFSTRGSVIHRLFAAGNAFS